MRRSPTPATTVTSEHTSIASTARASADADGDALVYSWDFGDGSPPAGGVRATHTYAEGGTYPVVLTVDDGTGLAQRHRRSAAITVKIDRPPVADRRRQPRGLRAATSSSSTAAARTIRKAACCAITGTSATAPRADIVNPTKTYTRGAVYPVTLTVQDDSGLPGQPAHRPRAGPGRRVADRRWPAPTSSPAPAPRSTSTARPRATPTAWSTASPGTSATAPPAAATGRPTSSRKPGDYRVVLTIDGDATGQCANTNADEMTVKVVEAPDARDRRPRPAIAVGAPARFDASGSTTASGQIVGWDWDFGDGATAQGATVEHVYASRPAPTSPP